MLKEFLQELLAKTAAQKFALVDGEEVFDKPVHLPPERKPHRATPLAVSSLTAIVEYLEANRDELTLAEYVIHVASPSNVLLRGPLDGYFRDRETILDADYSVDGASALATWKPLDEGRIILMSQFANINAAEDARANLLTVLRNVVRENLEIREDETGTSQTVTTREGVALKGLAKIENPVMLTPFATFPEVAQVTRPFIFRIRQDLCFTLQPADGGAWELEAVARVKDWLIAELVDKKINVPVIG